MDSKKTGMRCSVQFCKNKASTRNVSFFQYPKDDRLVLWIKNCGTENLIEELYKKNSYKVCGDHFVDSMFLNSTTKNRLVFNAIPSIFNDEIMFERTKLAKVQLKTDVDPQYFDDSSKDQSSYSNSIPGAEGLGIHSSGSMNTSDASNESCSSITTTNSSNQTPGYLSTNTPRKLKLAMEIKSGKQEIKNLKKTIGHKCTKSGRSVKTGHVFPSNMKVHIDSKQINVQYYSTHLWHTKDIGKLRLFNEDRSKIAGKLSLDVPVNKILQDVRSSNVVMDSIKRIHLLEKKDIYNIKRDFNISYSIKKHENDAISVDLWVKEMMKKGDESPILYYKQQGVNDNCVPYFTVNDFCLVIMTQFQSELLLKFGKDKVCLDGMHGLHYNFRLYTVVVVDEYGNGYPVSFCFSNRSDTTVYSHFFRCIKNITGNINANIFMSDDEPAFYNAWNDVMGPASKQLLCTWHVSRNWAKNVRKIHSNEKQNIVLKTLKALLYETDENNFVIELQKVLDNLLNDEDTADFGKYFKTTYSQRVEKWAYLNRKHVCINTNMYLEALHKSIKYCYLEGENCKRLDLLINALMSLVRDKSFERIIKIPKQKMSYKLTQIIAAHNKSTKITPDMVVEVNGNWLVNSETDIHTQYRVEKTTVSCDCLLRCNVCKICVHTYKCTCMNNVIYFNICKHIHACAKRQTITDSETVQNQNQSLPLPYNIAVDNGFLQKQGKLKQNENIMKNNEEIKNKLEMIHGMYSRVNMNEEDQMYIIKQCDNILTMLGKKIDFKKTSNLELTSKRKIEPQARFISKKKVPNQHLSSIEGTQIRESLKNSIEFLTISTTPAFDHSYL